MANLTNEKAEFAIAIFRHFSPFFAIFRHWPPPLFSKIQLPKIRPTKLEIQRTESRCQKNYPFLVECHNVLDVSLAAPAMANFIRGAVASNMLVGPGELQEYRSHRSCAPGILISQCAIIQY